MRLRRGEGLEGEKQVSLSNIPMGKEVVINSTKESKKKEKQEEAEGESKVLKVRCKLFKKLYNLFFVIESPAFEPVGLCPSFEKEVLYDKYLVCSFTQPSLFWKRVYHSTRPLYHSVSVNKEVK